MGNKREYRFTFSTFSEHHCSCSKTLVTIKVIKMILIMIGIIIILKKIVKCRGRSRIHTTTKTKLLVTYTNQIPLANITKSVISDVVRVLYETAYSSFPMMNRGRPFLARNFTPLDFVRILLMVILINLVVIILIVVM